MAETYEKEGILYFREPFRSDLVEWSDTHLGLNTIILKNSEDFGNRIISVVAVSTDKCYNDALFDVKKGLTGVEILMGIPEEEVNCIDSIFIQSEN